VDRRRSAELQVVSYVCMHQVPCLMSGGALIERHTAWAQFFLQIGLCVLGNEMVNWHEYATNFERSDMK